MNTTTINCLECGSPKEVRLVDIKRGWGKFCSKSCKAKYQERITNGQYRRYLKDKDNDYDDYGHIFTSGEEGHGQD